MNVVESVKADAKTINEILDKTKYDIDVFQREYRWKREHMEQLLSDLESKFLSNYEESHNRKDVQSYSRYYLGSIIISLKNNKRSIVDGQQRLTSLTLLLMYLNNLQNGRSDLVKLDDLIFSEKYGERSYNLQVPDRIECLDALYKKGEFDPTGKVESIRNLVERYQDVVELFPDELKGKALPYFIDWLINNVMLVEIKTYSDDDAYTIFETMNDRGLNLTSTEMLKGFLLSNIESEKDGFELNELWKKRITEIRQISEDEDLEFFKAWLRAKYAQSIRPGKKGAENEDFEKIASRFHSWVRDNKASLGLQNQSDFEEFIRKYFDFYSTLYLKIDKAASHFQKTLEYVYYIDSRGFPRTFYCPLLIAPIKMTDDEITILKKIALVSKFLEMFIVFRSVNYRTLAYSSIRYTMFSLIKEIRDKDLVELTKILKEKVLNFDENLEGIGKYTLYQQNKRFVHFILARMTAHIEEKCGIQSSFEDYVNPLIAKPFEIEHIWADNYDAHKDEFDQKQDFIEYRNRLGALLLVPRGFNQSYGSLPFESKLPHYYGQNLLAKTLSQLCYQNNPSFLQYKDNSNIPFGPHDHFKKNDIITRQSLYKKICEEIWNINGFDEIVAAK